MLECAIVSAEYMALNGKTLVHLKADIALQIRLGYY